jgi:pimeloyl-ACP methyl ester carboxylesterase
MILTTKDGPLYFETDGEGPPLVFVSGWAMSCECWRPVVSVLKRRHRCLIYDTRGIARSQPASIDARFGVEDHAEDLHAIMDATDTYDATMIGHETGALIAAECAVRHQQDLNSLVIVSPRAPMPENDIKNLAVFTPASLALRELANYPLIRNLVARGFRRAPKSYRDRLFQDFADLSPRAAYETALAVSNNESRAALEKLIESSRTLIVCGEKDRKGRVEARRLFALANVSRLATMRDCGFLPMLEYPGQFVKLIDGFVGGSDAERQALRRRS